MLILGNPFPLTPTFSRREGARVRGKLTSSSLHHPPGNNRQGDHHDQHGADNHRHHDAGDVQQAKAEGHQPHQKGGDDHPGHAAGAAENIDAAEHRHGDNRQLPAHRQGGAGTAEP